MNQEMQIQGQWTVDETLRERPETTFIFIKHQTQCIGCYLQKFCTLQEVTEIYHLNLDGFLKELNKHKTKEKI
jgi:hybrid cluster-associated redox disulfide protein